METKYYPHANQREDKNNWKPYFGADIHPARAVSIDGDLLPAGRRPMFHAHK
ncbi:hypothetical protein PV773_15590 [Mesorhizobium sp. CC13]